MIYCDDCDFVVTDTDLVIRCQGCQRFLCLDCSATHEHFSTQPHGEEEWDNRFTKEPTAVRVALYYTEVESKLELEKDRKRLRRAERKRERAQKIIGAHKKLHDFPIEAGR